MQTKKRHMATIKDVAELARVSQMTVSRVMNDQTAVRETTRKRVQEAMRALNYRPNIMARNLAGRAGLFIGLIYRNPSYGYLSEFLLGALDTCRRFGHYLIVEEPFLDQDMVDLEAIEKRFLDTSIQALIVVPPLSDDPKLIDTLERTGMPFVCISSKMHEFSGPGVGMNDITAAAELTDYLVSLGHSRIALIKGPPDHLASELRFTGFKRALGAHKLPLAAEDVVSGDFTYVSGMRAARSLLERPTPPTAIFAGNDDMAAGAIAAAHQLGLKVPQDLSIVGFDDTANASAIWPPLTTIRQPIREMAKAAIEILERKVGDVLPISGEVEKRTLEHKLIVRDSTAPPPLETHDD